MTSARAERIKSMLEQAFLVSPGCRRGRQRASRRARRCSRRCRALSRSNRVRGFHRTKPPRAASPGLQGARRNAAARDTRPQYRGSFTRRRLSIEDPMRYTQILALSALGMFLATGCTKAETPAVAAAKPVAVVNGAPISPDVWNLYVKTRHGGKTPGDLTAEEQKEALDELIGMYAGAQEADKQKLGEGEPKARLELVGKSAMAELLFKKFTRRQAADRCRAEGGIRRAHRGSAEGGVPCTAHPRRRGSEGQGPHLAARQGRGLREAREGQLEGRLVSRRRRSRLVQPEPDGEALLGRREAARDRQVHGDAGQVRVRLARHQARGKARDDAASLRCGQGQLGPLVNQKKFETYLKDLVKSAKVERSL